MAGGQKRSIVVTIDGAHMPTIHHVADSLRSAGMQVERVMANVGIISGKIAVDKKHLLEQVPGVAAVEPDEEMRAI